MKVVAIRFSTIFCKNQGSDPVRIRIQVTNLDPGPAINRSATLNFLYRCNAFLCFESDIVIHFFLSPDFAHRLEKKQYFYIEYRYRYFLTLAILNDTPTRVGACMHACPPTYANRGRPYKYVPGKFEKYCHQALFQLCFKPIWLG